MAWDIETIPTDWESQLLISIHKKGACRKQKQTNDNDICYKNLKIERKIKT